MQTLNGVASTLRYAYNKSGRLASLTYPDGSVADYVRDTLGRISQIGLTRPGQARQVVVNGVTYAAFGPATGWTYGNGRQLQRPLDLDYRLQAVHDPAAGGLSLAFGYDPVGSITELKNGAGTVVQAKYAYDALGRLTQTQDGATATPIETYGYDATGNRTSLTTAAGTSTYSYPADSHHLVAVGGEARGHDAAGNTTSIGGKAFTYNDANRVNAVKLGGAVAERYGYNHRGERVLRAPEGGDAQITVYDEAGQWLGNYSAAGQAQQQAIWLDNYPVALINVVAAGVPELAYVQPDHLGTPRVVIDAVRDVAIWEWSNKSEVFGDQAPANDPDGDGVAFELALRFPGQQATDASGMFYNYQREYDPVVGRYSQSDPIGLAGGLNSYLYVDAAPIAYSDPLGLCPACLLARPPVVVRGPGNSGRGAGVSAGGGRSHPWYGRPQQKISPKGGKPKNDIPSWARGTGPRNGETPVQYAERVCKEFGQDPGKGQGSNLSKLKKFAETHFTPSGDKPSFLDEFFFNFSQDPLMEYVPEDLRVDGEV